MPGYSSSKPEASASDSSPLGVKSVSSRPPEGRKCALQKGCQQPPVVGDVNTPGGGRLEACRPSSFRSASFMGVVLGLSLFLALIVIVLDV